MLVSNLKKMDKEKKKRIFQKAEQFIKNNTLWKKKNFVKLVKKYLAGEKKGKETGTTSCIAVKDVERISSI